MRWPADVAVPRRVPRVFKPVTLLCKPRQHTVHVNKDACAHCGVTGLYSMQYPLRAWYEEPAR